MATVECPYCEHDQEIELDGDWGAEPGILYKEECHHCERWFGFYTELEVSHSSKALPCTNGEPHSLKKNESAAG